MMVASVPEGGGDKIALGERHHADAAVDGCGDRAIAQIQLRVGDVGDGGEDVRLVLVAGCLGLVQRRLRLEPGAVQPGVGRECSLERDRLRCAHLSAPKT